MGDQPSDGVGPDPSDPPASSAYATTLTIKPLPKELTIEKHNLLLKEKLSDIHFFPFLSFGMRLDHRA